MTEENGNAETEPVIEPAPTRKKKASKRKSRKAPIAMAMSNDSLSLGNIPADASQNLSDDPMAMHQKMAEAIAENLKKKEEEDQAHVEEEEAEGTVWYIQCRKRHPGAFLTKSPFKSRLFPQDWFNAHKPPGVPWPSADVPCQQCEMMLPVARHKSGHLVPIRRFLLSMTREEFATLASGG